MAKSVPALVEPALLVWARKTAGIKVDAAAKKVGVAPEELAAWERGDGGPSVAKLRALGAAYKRPIAVFYLPVPPTDFAPLKDYRRLPGDGEREQSPAVLLAGRRAYQRREAALELYEVVEGEPPAFDLSADLDEDPETVGLRLRSWLRVEAVGRSFWSDQRETYNGLRSLCEQRGVLVFQASGVAVSEMRGFSIGEFPLPVVACNSKDAYAGRAFTVLHELAHLALQQAGLCDLIEAARRRPEDQRVEVFCNAVAAAALMPTAAFLNDPDVVVRRRVDDWPDEILKAVARRFGTSREAVLRRLLTLGRTTQKHYQERRHAWDEALRLNPPPKKKIPVSQAQKAVSAAGRLFTRLVLDGYYRDIITASSVAAYLGVKLGHLERVEQLLARGDPA